MSEDGAQLGDPRRQVELSHLDALFRIRRRDGEWTDEDVYVARQLVRQDHLQEVRDPMRRVTKLGQVKKQPDVCVEIHRMPNTVPEHAVLFE